MLSDLSNDCGENHRQVRGRYGSAGRKGAPVRCGRWGRRIRQREWCGAATHRSPERALLSQDRLGVHLSIVEPL